MPADIETMAYAGSVPWHGLGIKNDEPISVDTALQQVPELGVDVERWDLYAVNPNDPDKRVRLDELQPVGTQVANVRQEVVSDEGVKPSTVLGVVSDAYRITQTRDTFRALETIIGEHEMAVETAISLSGGQVNTLLLRRPEAVTIVGDAVMPYLLIVNSFDGSHALTFASTPIRVVCSNTLAMAMAGNRTRKASVRHTGDIDEKLDEVRRAMGLADTYIDSLAETAESMSKTKLSAKDIARLIKATIPVPEGNPSTLASPTREILMGGINRAKEQRIRLKSLIETAPDLDEHRNTAWGFLNGVIAFEDHVVNKVSERAASDEQWRKRYERHMQNVAIKDRPLTTNAERALAGVA